MLAIATIKGPSEGSLKITSTQSTYRAKYAPGGLLHIILYTYIHIHKICSDLVGLMHL